MAIIIYSWEDKLLYCAITVASGAKRTIAVSVANGLAAQKLQPISAMGVDLGARKIIVVSVANGSEVQKLQPPYATDVASGAKRTTVSNVTKEHDLSTQYLIVIVIRKEISLEFIRIYSQINL